MNKRMPTVVALATGAFALIGYVLYCLAKLRATELAFTLCEWPAELDGTRIAFLSDFHLGRFGTSRRVIARAIAEVAEFRPNLTVLGGDYFDGPISTEDVALLTPLREHDLVIAVLGNHDHARGRKHLKSTVQLLEGLGVVVLRNEAHHIALNSSDLWFVGLDDPFTLRDDVERATAQLPVAAFPVLLAAHAPILSAFGDMQRIAIALSGHTHGGQIRLLPSGDVPGKRLLRWLSGDRGPHRDPDLYRGIHYAKNTPIAISDGLGVSLLPIRFRTRPEVLLITLYSSEAQFRTPRHRTNH